MVKIADLKDDGDGDVYNTDTITEETILDATVGLGGLQITGEELEEDNGPDHNVPLPSLDVPHDTMHEIMFRVSDEDMKRCRRTSRGWKSVVSEIMLVPHYLKTHLHVCKSVGLYLEVRNYEDPMLQFYMFGDDKLIPLPDPGSLKQYNVLSFCEGCALMGCRIAPGPLILYDTHTSSEKHISPGTISRSISVVLGQYVDSLEYYVFQIYNNDKRLSFRMLDFQDNQWREGGPLAVSRVVGKGLQVNNLIFHLGREKEGMLLLSIDVETTNQCAYPFVSQVWEYGELCLINGNVTVAIIAEDLHFYQFNLQDNNWLRLPYSVTLRQIGWETDPLFTSIAGLTDGFMLLQNRSVDGVEIMKVNTLTNSVLISNFPAARSVSGGSAARSCLLLRNRAFSD